MKYLLLTACIVSPLVGCDGKENDNLKRLNSELQNEVIHLKDEVNRLNLENNKLQATAGYHFRVGQDYLSDGKWAEAMKSFQVVINKYPNDPLVDNAKSELAKADREYQIDQERRRAEEESAKQAREKEIAESGESISYADFYAAAKMGMTVGRRYRFSACLNQIPCINAHETGTSQSICSIDLQIEDVQEHKKWLRSGDKHCGVIVASMLNGGYVAVHRLH